MQMEQIKLGKLKSRSEFLYVRDGKSIAQSSVVVQMRNNPDRDKDIYIGFTASKKIGNAVVRNRAKRRLRAVAQQILPKLGRQGYDYVFIARYNTATVDWEKLVNDTQKALSSLS